MTKVPVPDRRPLFAPRKEITRAELEEQFPRRSAPNRHPIKAAKAAAEEAAREAITETLVNGQPPKRKKGNLIGVWIDDAMLVKLDKHRGGQTRPQAIREILEKHL